jgi:hypothetical protein
MHPRELKARLPGSTSPQGIAKKGALAAKALLSPGALRDSLAGFLRQAVEIATERGSAPGCLLAERVPAVATRTHEPPADRHEPSAGERSKCHQRRCGEDEHQEAAAAISSFMSAPMRTRISSRPAKDRLNCKVTDRDVNGAPRASAMDYLRVGARARSSLLHLPASRACGSARLTALRDTGRTPAYVTGGPGFADVSLL